jgi:hypothetical protein
MEALFGLAPNQTLDELLALIAPDSVMSHETHDVDLINQSLVGIDELESDKAASEEGPKNQKKRFSSSRRRNYRSRRPSSTQGHGGEKPQLNRTP